MSKKSTVSILLILILIIVIAFFIYNSKSLTNNNFYNSNKVVTFLITDPFSVPFGTNAIFINYSNAILSINSGNNKRNVSISPQGTVELQSYGNFAHILGSVYIPENSTLNTLSFKINSAEIELNNTNYNLGILEKNITTSILNKTPVINNQSVVVDISGTIIPIFSNNSIQFFSSPSASTASYASSNASSINMPADNSSIYISTVSLHSKGNETILMLSVKDNSSKSVILSTVSVLGEMSISGAALTGSINISQIEKLKNIINYSFVNSTLAGINLSSTFSSILNYLKPISSKIMGGYIGNVLSGIAGYIPQNTSSKLINALHSINYSIINNHLPKNLSENLTLLKNNITTIGTNLQREYFSSLDSKKNKLESSVFIIEKNGTLVLPTSNMSSFYASSGISLAPGSIVNLTYSGNIIFAGNDIFIPIENNTYTVWITGSNGLAYSKSIKAV